MADNKMPEEMSKLRDALFESDFCKPKYSSNGGYQMYCAGFNKCYELMKEREIKLKAQLEKATAALEMIVETDALYQTDAPGVSRLKHCVKLAAFALKEIEEIGK